jgi:opacity protein-like surface antigen
MNVALVVYSISTDLVVEDTWTGEEIRQNVSSETQAVVGYDITLGIDLNFSNTVALDGGIRYVKSFSVPQQLGEGSEKIHPQYFQIYLGIGVSFDMAQGE